jgi:1-acyl-sn-glycerol-3-phosphate acyltransferase
MIVLRSLLFAAWFYLISTPWAILLTLALPLPRRVMIQAVRLWARVILFGLRVLAGVRVEVRGLERLPADACLIAAKHQCALDFVGPFAFLPDACFVLKTELLAIPFFGWNARKARMIPIDRGGGAATLKAMVRTARARLSERRQLVIFPEGTRKAPGDPPDYKPGVAALYRELDLPCLPMATNSGVHWPAHGFLRRPGVVVYEVLEPIPPGLPRAQFMRELETRIEAASTALVDAGI